MRGGSLGMGKGIRSAFYGRRKKKNHPCQSGKTVVKYPLNVRSRKDRHRHVRGRRQLGRRPAAEGAVLRDRGSLHEKLDERGGRDRPLPLGRGYRRCPAGGGADRDPLSGG